MKRLLYIFFGAVGLGFIYFLIGSAISQYQVRVLYYNPDESGIFVDWFLMSWPLVFILGGFAGNWLYKKRSYFVITNPLKKFFYIFSGVLLGTIIGFFAASWISQIYDYYWATTGILTFPEALALFAIWACFMVFGGIVGNLLFSHNLTKHLKLPNFDDSKQSNV